MENKDETAKAVDKDTLSQQDIESGIKNINGSDQPHAALETADGKNNGAEPAVFKNERKSHP
jgi:hypothetical protein